MKAGTVSSLLRVCLAVGVLVAPLLGCGLEVEEPEAESAAAVGGRAFGLDLRVREGLLDGYSARNAYWMARFAGFAYEADRGGILTKLREVGARGEVTFVENTRTHTQAFFYEEPDLAVVAFRGTESLRDVWTDVNFRMAETPYGRAHAGFLGAFESVWNDGDRELTSTSGAGTTRAVGLRSLLARRHPLVADGKRLFVTGHSLGGALGVLLTRYLVGDPCPDLNRFRPALFGGHYRDEAAAIARRCGLKRLPLSLYTYGAPRAGSKRFSTFDYAEIPVAQHVRVVYPGDPVTTIPDRDLDVDPSRGPGVLAESVYHHAGEDGWGSRGLAYLTADERVDLRVPPMTYFETSQRALVSRLVGGSAHRLEGYVQRLERQLEAGGSRAWGLEGFQKLGEEVDAIDETKLPTVSVRQLGGEAALYAKHPAAMWSSDAPSIESSTLTVFRSGSFYFCRWLLEAPSGVQVGFYRVFNASFDSVFAGSYERGPDGVVRRYGWGA